MAAADMNESQGGKAADGVVTLSLPLDQALAFAEQQYETGRLAAAEAVCQAILRARADCAPALHLLGIIAHRGGNLAVAIAFVRRAAAIESDGAALYNCNLCEMLRLAGQLDDALAAGRRALALSPDLPHALNNVGIVHYERDEFDQAASHYRRALAVMPSYVEAYSNLGNVLRAQKKYDEALAAYEQALRMRPDYAEAINNMGTALRDMGRATEAEAAYRQALALKPDDTGVLNNLALALKETERFDEASALLTRSLSLNADNVETLTYLALVRLEQKQIPHAEAAAQRALALAGDDPDALNAMGLVRYEQQDSDAALIHYRRAIALKPQLADAHSNMGNILKEAGDFTAAREAFERAIEIEPREFAYHLNLADTKKFAAGDAQLAALEAVARDPAALSNTARTRLNFTLSKAYDDLGRYDEAFARMHEGNGLKRGRIAYDEAATLGLLDRIAATFDRRLVGSMGDVDQSPSLPVFVVGMPRSGSTLVEQILASHPAVHGAGELPDLNRLFSALRGPGGDAFRYPEDAATLPADQLRETGRQYVDGLRRRAPDAQRVTDKMPGNFMLLGLIHLALPGAQIIHVHRDPRDTCLSCYSKLFSAEQNFTYDLGELGRYYRGYAALMAHWREVLPPGRVLDVRYEDVIADVEGSARRIVGHCGLDWDPACIAFHETRRPVRTASASQVRRPIYRTSQGRWRAYAAHLGPLVEALGDALDSGG